MPLDSAQVRSTPVVMVASSSVTRPPVARTYLTRIGNGPCHSMAWRVDAPLDGETILVIIFSRRRPDLIEAICSGLLLLEIFRTMSDAPDQSSTLAPAGMRQSCFTTESQADPHALANARKHASYLASMADMQTNWLLTSLQVLRTDDRSRPNALLSATISTAP